MLSLVSNSSRADRVVPKEFVNPPAPRELQPAKPVTAERLREIAENLLGGPITLTLTDLAERAGVSEEFARTFWRGMGFKNVTNGAVMFTEADVDALRWWVVALSSEMIDETALVSLLRAQSFTMDRLALWQVEAMVDNVQRKTGLDDTAARYVMLEHIDESDEFMAEQIVYSWRRHMVSLAERIHAEIDARNIPLARDGLPLPRAFGFVDMVSFTTRSRQLGSRDLSRLVEGFEYTARDVITANGARVVKMLGDAVLYIADDVLTGARVSLAMIDAIGAQEDLLPVRASLVWGRVVSRSGDVFGPAVNLASRLMDAAPAGCVYTDPSTAALLAVSPRAADFLMKGHPPVELPGIGEVAPVELTWSSPASADEVWVPR